MKFSPLARPKFQTMAISAAVALSIVAGGIALRIQIANRTSPNEQTSARSPSSTQQPSTNRPSSAAASSPQKESPIATSANPPNTEPGNAEPNQKVQLSAISITPIPSATASPATPAGASVAFNHLPYKEANPARLQAAGTFVRGSFERTELLDLEAANAFIIMVNEAKAQGIDLMPISGFRSVAEQQELFAEQTERHGSEAAAARLSAPAEHSEHHTGYAIDIGDSNRPDTDLSSQFADTAAYQWLLNNAYIFGFEQSFPQGNSQGLNFEPWHWRYVQSERAAQVFAAAKANATPQP